MYARTNLLIGRHYAKKLHRSPNTCPPAADGVSFPLSFPRQVRRIVLTEEQMLFAREESEDIIYEVDLCSIAVLPPPTPSLSLFRRRLLSSIAASAHVCLYVYVFFVSYG